MTLTIFTDGGSLNNPGPSASAYVIYEGNKIIAEEGRFIGHATNNQAEYQALIFSLEKALELQKTLTFDKIGVIADSELLVRQVNGLYKVKNAAIREYIMKIRTLEGSLNVPMSYTHTLREGNQVADALV